MAGTAAGGRVAAQKNKAKHGVDFYSKIGSMGGKKGHTGGFYVNRNLARIAGAKGGQVSRRNRAMGAEVQQRTLKHEHNH